MGKSSAKKRSVSNERRLRRTFLLILCVNSLYYLITSQAKSRYRRWAFLCTLLAESFCLFFLYRISLPTVIRRSADKAGGRNAPEKPRAEESALKAKYRDLGGAEEGGGETVYEGANLESRGIIHLAFDLIYTMLFVKMLSLATPKAWLLALFFPLSMYYEFFMKKPAKRASHRK